jgi:hypothetical protein
VLRNALALADEAERQIVLSGGVAPPREDLLAAFLPAAKAVTAAARQLDEARRLHGEAEAVARLAAAATSGSVRSVVAWWLAAVPPSGEGEPATAAEAGC